MLRVYNFYEMSNNNSSNSSASPPKTWTQKLGMVAQLVGVWDESKSSVEAWLMNFESVMGAMKLSEEDTYLALLSGIGMERTAMLMREAKQNKTQLKDDENQAKWMMNALVTRYGKAKSGYDLLKEFMGRRLKTDESVTTYCAAKADLYNQVLVIFKSMTGTPDDEVLVTALIDGLPSHLQSQVKSITASQSTKGQEMVTSVIKSVREATPKKPSSKEAEKQPKQKKGGKPKSPTNAPAGKACYYCKKEGHIAANCPDKKAESEKEEETPPKSPYKKKLRDRKDAKKLQAMYDQEVESEDDSLYTLVKRGNKLRFVNLIVNKKVKLCMVDTGAARSVMSRAVAKELRLTKQPSVTKSMETPAGLLDVMGKATVTIGISPEKEFETEFLVIEDFPLPILLGGDFLQEHQAVVDYGREKMRVGTQWVDLLDKNGTLFLAPMTNLECHVDSNLGDEEKKVITQLINTNKDLFDPIQDFRKVQKNTVHHIPVETKKPVVEPLRRIPQWKRVRLAEMVEEMLGQGVIRKSKSPYAAATVLVSKKDGTERFCVDYKKLNDETTKDKYPMPRMENIHDALVGAKYFATLDMQSGYWQIPVAEEDVPKTAFRTPDGLFEFLVMPFGLCNAPATFQREMDVTLSEQIGKSCMVYLDDIVIWGDSISQLASNVQDIFTALQNKGWFLKAKKCKFGFQELVILGNLVGHGQVRPDPDKIRALEALERPANKKQLRSFLGSTGYFRRFIEGYSKLTAPLFELLKEETKYEWSEERQRIFLLLKDLLSKGPILKLPNLEIPFVVRSDASGYALGAVLLQQHDGRALPVEYWSRKLNGAERNYTTMEREGLAAVEATKHWRCYLEGTHFTLETDHQALKALMKAKDPSARLARWKLALQGLDFEIVHRKGTSMGIPDVLSRDNSLLVILSEDEDLKSLQNKDSGLAPIFDYLTKKKLPEDGKAAKELVALSYNLVIEDGVLLHVRVPHGTNRKRHLQKRLVIPESIRGRVLAECHDSPVGGHLGFDRTYTKVQERFWWPDVYNDVKGHVDKCEACQKSKKSRLPHSLDITPVVVSSPWEMVGVDFLGPLPVSKNGNLYLLTFCDYFTKWMVAVPTKAPDSESVANALVSQIYAKFGAPSRLISDNGAAFNAALTKKLCEKLGIEKVFTTPYHPAGNRQVERWNSTVVGMLRCYADANLKNWDDQIDMVTFAYNSSVHKTTGYSLFYLNYGREPRLPLESMLEKKVETTSAESHVRELLSRLEDAIKGGREATEESKRKSHFRLADDNDNKKGEFKVGKFVMVKLPDPKKLEDQYEGLFEILKIVGSTHLEIQRYGSPEKIHVSRVKKTKLQPLAAPTIPSAEEKDDWEEVPPDPKAKPKDLIGQHVRVWWPTLKKWYDGTVTGVKGKRHSIRYDVRSADTPKHEDEVYFEHLMGVKKVAKWFLLKKKSVVDNTQ